MRGVAGDRRSVDGRPARSDPSDGSRGICPTHRRWAQGEQGERLGLAGEAEPGPAHRRLITPTAKCPPTISRRRSWQFRRSGDATGSARDDSPKPSPPRGAPSCSRPPSEALWAGPGARWGDSGRTTARPLRRSARASAPANHPVDIAGGGLPPGPRTAVDETCRGGSSISRASGSGPWPSRRASSAANEPAAAGRGDQLAHPAQGPWPSRRASSAFAAPGVSSSRPRRRPRRPARASARRCRTGPPRG